jgi:hypothetical protein
MVFVLPTVLWYDLQLSCALHCDSFMMGLCLDVFLSFHCPRLDFVFLFFCLLPFCLVLSCLVLSYLVLSCRVVSCRDVSCLGLAWLGLSCLAVAYRVVS